MGLHNPHPAAGQWIVDGLRVSADTTAVPPALAHAALAPVRAAVAVGVADALGSVGPRVAAADRLASGGGGWWTPAGRLLAAGLGRSGSDLVEL